MKPWERHLSLVTEEGDAPPPRQAFVPREERAPVEAPKPSAPAAASFVPPPSKEPPPPEMPLVESPMAAQWLGIVEGVRGQKRILGTVLEHARPLSLVDGTLSLGFVKGRDDYALRSITEELNALQTLLSETLKSPTKVDLVTLAEGQPVVASLAESNERAEREQKAARLRGGREHEVIKRAAAILGAEIEDVRDLGGANT